MNWIFKQSLAVSGFPIERKLMDFESIQSLELKEREELQQKRAKNIFQFHFQNNSYYRSLCVQRSNRNFIEDWCDVPILSKRHLQVPFEKILSQPFDKGNMHVHNTSGSTGTPFKFAKTKNSHAMAWALYNDRLKSLNITYGDDLQARFYGIPQKGIAYYKERIKDLVAGRVRFPVFDMSDSVLSEITNKFRKNRFVYINGYTNSIVLFANYLIKREIVLKELCPSLRLVIPTSEVCTSVHRDLMKRAFGVDVYNEYGAAELDVIGMEDSSHNFILNNETLLVELLDDTNQPVKRGALGRVVVTSLFNEAMPFIRYDLGDMAIQGDPTSTHHTLLSVEGRKNDAIQLPSGKISAGLTIYYVAKLLFEGKPNIREFVVHQMEIDSFEFHYTADSNLSEVEKRNLEIGFNTYLEPGLRIDFKRFDKIERSKSGKMKTFISHLS